MVVVVVGWGWGGRERAHGDTGSQGYCVTLGWRSFDLELLLRGLVSEAAPYDSLQETCNNSSQPSQARFRVVLLFVRAPAPLSDSDAESFISDCLLVVSCPAVKFLHP